MFDLIVGPSDGYGGGDYGDGCGYNGYGDGFGNGDFWGGDGDGDGCDSYSEPLLEEGALCLI